MSNLELAPKILVLGANGFLGKNVSQVLNKNNDYKIIESHGKKSLDLRNYNELDNFLAKNQIDYVINCAAFVGGIAFGYDYPAELIRENTLITGNLYEACYQNKIKSLINPISNCAYPEDEFLFEEENFLKGPPHESVFEYGMSRRFSVVCGKAYFNEHGFTSTNVVLSNMFGPFDHFEEKRSHALGALIKKIHNAKENNLDKVTIWGTGKPIREWLFVRDGATALIKSISLENNHYFFNVGVNKGMTILEMATKIAKLLDWNGEFEFNTDKPDGAMEKRVLSSESIKLLDWSPEVSFDDGLVETVEWYKKNLSADEYK